MPVLAGDEHSNAPLGTTPLGRPNKSSSSSSRGMPPTPGTEAARSQFYARETQKLAEAAKQTISQLKSMLKKKTKLVNEYKHRMDEQATRYIAEKERDQEEIRRLTDRVYDDNNANIEKLKEAFEKLENGSSESGTCWRRQFNIDGSYGWLDRCCCEERFSYTNIGRRNCSEDTSSKTCRATAGQALGNWMNCDIVQPCCNVR